MADGQHNGWTCNEWMIGEMDDWMNGWMDVYASSQPELTSVYSYVADQLAGLLEGLPAVVTAVCEAAPIYVFLVVPGIGGECSGE